MAKQATQADTDATAERMGIGNLARKREPQRDSVFGSPTPSPEPKKPDDKKPKVVTAKVEPVKGSEAEATSKARTRKQDIFCERVNLHLKPETKDKIDLIAKQLQRMKSDSTERITANTVMRVALDAVLERFEMPQQGIVNSEEELQEFVKRLLS